MEKKKQEIVPTKQEKQLLLTDLCSRLPYDTIINADNGKYREDMKLRPIHIEGFDNWDIKPYLRPMSSMTEEEKKILWEKIDKDMDILAENLDAQIIHVYEGRCYRGNPIYHEIDFLNKNHFDWRGLIPMGLALEALEGMYK